MNATNLSPLRLASYSTLLAGALIAAQAAASPEDCEWSLTCPGCFVGVYTNAMLQDIQRASCELGRDEERGLPFTPVEPLDPVFVNCEEAARGLFTCTVFPQPLEPGDFSYAWIIPNGLQAVDQHYSSWSPQRSLTCTEAGPQDLAVIVTSPSGSAGSATLEIDCGSEPSR